jgi:chemotaxis protein CheC
MSKWEKLQKMHLDVLKEIGNIGAGNAATSLAQMTGQKIDMEVPQVEVNNINKLIKLIGTEEEIVTCISLDVTGDAPSIVFFILKEKSALDLVNKMMSMPSGTFKKIDETAQSALQELGNILTGSILNAMSSMTNLNIMPSVPAFAHDMLGAVLSAAILERGYFDDNILIIETRFFDEDSTVDGYLFLLPQADSLEIIFKSVGIVL